MKGLLFAAIFLFQVQTPGQIETGVVTGKLRAVNGTPAVGVRVAAMPVGKEGDQATPSMLEGISQTDDTGSYRLVGIPPGRYYIFAGLIDLPNYYPGVSGLAGATAIVVEPGATVGNIDFALPRGGSSRISGRVTGKTSATAVLLTPQVANAGRVQASTVTDASGAFTFSQVLPGTYRLSVPGPGGTTMEVSVTDGDREGLLLATTDCNAGFQVRGRLVGTASAPIGRVQLRGAKTSCVSQTQVEADGTFVLEKVPPDIYAISLTPTPLGYETAGVEVANRDVAVSVRLPVTFELKGRVTVEDGRLPPRLSRGDTIKIQAQRRPGNEVVSQSINNDGTFELQLFGEGSYRFTVPSVPANYTVKSMSYGSLDLIREPLRIDGPLSEEIRLVLGFERGYSPGVRVSGRVIPATGGDLSRPEAVALVSPKGGRNALWFETPLKPDGSFEFIGVESGRYDLQTVPDSPVALREILVGRTDLTGLDFTIPVLFKINGAIEWRHERGSGILEVPSSVSIQFSRKDEGSGRSLLVWSSLAQAGAFQAYLPEGDYRFSLGGLPSRFNIRSMAHGATELTQRDLSVRSSLNPMNIRVTLGDR